MKIFYHFKSEINIFLYFVFFVGYCEGDDVVDSTWDSAINSIFAMRSQVAPVSNCIMCKKRIGDLLDRQNIPKNAMELRNLDDKVLQKLAILAGVAGMSRWLRDKTDPSLILLTEEGTLIHPYSPGAVESDVMLCIICALLTVIATFHLIPPIALSNSNSEKNNNNLQQQPNLINLKVNTSNSNVK
jgi:hypothetical protein